MRCEEARQPHRPAVMHAGSRVRRNKVCGTVMGAGVAQCSCGVDYRPLHLGGSRHEAYQKLRHSYEAYETIWRRPSGGLGPARRASIGTHLDKTGEGVRQSASGDFVFFRRGLRIMPEITTQNVGTRTFYAFGPLFI